MHYRDQIAFGLTLSLLTSGYACATTLEQAVKETLITHPQISGSINSRHSADEDLKAAKGGYLPTLDVSAGTGWEQTDNAPRAPRAITCAICTAANRAST